MSSGTKYNTRLGSAIKVGKALLGVSLAVGSIFCSMTPSIARNYPQMHPRRAQLNGRFAQLNTRMSSSYGSLGGQYGQLQSQSNAIQSQARQEAQANGGYLTRSQQHQINQQYSSLGQQVTTDQALGAPSGQWMHNNPNSAQVLNGAAGINQQLSNGYGNLGGHYVGLEQRDNNIRQTAYNQAQADGGNLTAQQQQRFDNREANLQNSINQYSGQ